MKVVLSIIVLFIVVCIFLLKIPIYPKEDYRLQYEKSMENIHFDNGVVLSLYKVITKGLDDISYEFTFKHQNTHVLSTWSNGYGMSYIKGSVGDIAFCYLDNAVLIIDKNQINGFQSDNEKCIKMWLDNNSLLKKNGATPFSLLYKISMIKIHGNVVDVVFSNKTLSKDLPDYFSISSNNLGKSWTVSN